MVAVVLLERLVLHLRYCTSCQLGASVAGGAMCENGARLWSAAGMPPESEVPYPLPAEWGPRDLPGTDFEIRPGPLVPKAMVN